MKDLCILQVEDEQGDIELVQYAFKRAGITHPLRSVTDGQMAMDYLSGVGDYADRLTYPVPCIILLDLKMPKVSGLEFLAWLRSQPVFKRTAVIIFSSSAQPVDVERAHDLGANSFIQKPSDLRASLHIAQILKAWWLDLNCFAPVCQFTTLPPKQPDPGAALLLSADASHPHSKGWPPKVFSRIQCVR